MLDPALQIHGGFNQNKSWRLKADLRLQDKVICRRMFFKLVLDAV